MAFGFGKRDKFGVSIAFDPSAIPVVTTSYSRGIKVVRGQLYMKRSAKSFEYRQTPAPAATPAAVLGTLPAETKDEAESVDER